MKKLVLTLFLIVSAICSHAQLGVFGISPAPVHQSFEYTYTSNPNLSVTTTSVGPWGGDLATASVEDTVMIVDDGTAADSLGCNALVNDLTGKIALIYRGSCNFFSKVQNAQNAGALAVILVNNTTGLINPSSAPANDNASITIPVVMISQADGAAIRAQIDLGEDVVVFIGNMSGHYGDNIGIYKDYLQSARAYATPALTAQNDTEYSVSLGAYVFNQGTNDVTDATLTVNIDYNGSSIHTETSSATAIVAGDTAYITLADFTQSTYPVGKYTITYTSSMTALDGNTLDNELTVDFEITDETYSLVPLDGNEIPIAETYTRSGSDGLTAYTPCIKYENTNANRIVADGMYFAASLDSASLDQEEFTLTAYQWNNVYDATATTFADNFTDLSEITNTIYNISGDQQKVMLYVPFNETVLMDNDTKYLFCITPTTNAEINFGFNNDIDYGLNNAVFDESVHPMQVVASAGTTWYSGFTTNQVPAFGIKTSDAASSGVFENNAIEGMVYPNPANDAVTISLKAEGNANVIVTDISGKVVMNNTMMLLNGKSKMNISSLETGIYIFNVVLENGTSSQFSVVKK